MLPAQPQAALVVTWRSAFIAWNPASRFGRAGWIVLGGLFVVLGALVPPVVGWASRTRTASRTRIVERDPDLVAVS